MANPYREGATLFNCVYAFRTIAWPMDGFPFQGMALDSHLSGSSDYY